MSVCVCDFVYTSYLVQSRHRSKATQMHADALCIYTVLVYYIVGIAGTAAKLVSFGAAIKL